MKQLVRYGLVGGVGFVLDFSIFNLLMITIADSSPFVNKVTSMTCALVFTYLAHSSWTFRGQAKKVKDRSQIIKHLITNLFAVFGALLPLAVSRYILRLEDLISDNLATNGVGFVIAVSIRFLLSKYWVFR